MQKRFNSGDPVLDWEVGQLDLAASQEVNIPAQDTHAQTISRLSREIRFRLGPPWMHEPDNVDHIAEVLSQAAGSIRGTQESPLARKCTVNVLQRMIFILEDKHGWANRPWLSQREPLRKQSAQ